MERVVKKRKVGKGLQTDKNLAKEIQLTAARRPRLMGKFCLNKAGLFFYQRTLVSISLLGVGLDKTQVSFIVVFSVFP